MISRLPSCFRLSSSRTLGHALLAGAWLALSTGQVVARQTESGVVLPAVDVVGTQTVVDPVAGYRATRSETATKTDTPLEQTPQSVTVVTRDQMRDQGASNVQDALTYAAGVRSDAYGLDSRTDSVQVRGAALPVTFIDGLRQSNGYYTSKIRPDPYTLERIEVLRGPAGMLYGQGNTAGVLNLVSKRPLDTFSGEVGVQIGSFGRKQVQTDVTGPLTEDGKWLYRVVALARDADTQVDYVRDDRYLLAPSLTFKPGAATTLTFHALHQRDRAGSTSQFFPWAGSITPNVNGKIPFSRFVGEPTDRYDTDRSSIGYSLSHQFNEDWTFRQNMRHASNEVHYFTHYANFFAIDPSTGMPGGWAIDPVNQRMIGRVAYGEIAKSKVTTVDTHLQGKLQSGGMTHTLLAGVDFTRYQLDSIVGRGADTMDVFNPVYGNPVALIMKPQPRSKQRQTGFYVQDQIKMEKWIVVAGLRHDRVNNARAGNRDESSSATTGRIGVMYQLAGGWSPYASYSESFTPQAGVDFYGQRYKPVEGGQVEAGVKYMPVDGKSQATVALWRTREKNQLTLDPVNPLNQIQTGKTKNRGVELEWKASLTPDFDAMAHYNYVKLDNRLSGVPSRQMAVWGKWRFSVGDVKGLSFGSGVRHMSAFRDGRAPRTPSVTLLDTMFSWENGQWRYALNVNNLTDKQYNATCLSRGDCWYGARRNAVATATRRF